jgi:hypothetical protein
MPGLSALAPMLPRNTAPHFHGTYSGAPLGGLTPMTRGWTNGGETAPPCGFGSVVHLQDEIYPDRVAWSLHKRSTHGTNGVMLKRPVRWGRS